MRVIVAGGGRVGAQLATALCGAGDEVTVVDLAPVRAAGLAHAASGAEVPGPRVVTGSACVVEVLEAAGALSADAVVACTGDDAKSLVIAAVAKRHLEVPRVVARCNVGEHERLFDACWGVDVAGSYTSAIVAAVSRPGAAAP